MRLLMNPFAETIKRNEEMLVDVITFDIIKYLILFPPNGWVNAHY